MAARLAQNPWVKEAALRRRLPNRLVVRVVERAPAAVLIGAQAHLVSGDGTILEPAQEEAGATFPVLRAPQGRGFSVGERVSGQELSGALGVWRQVQIAPVLAGRRPREVALAPDGSLEVRMEPGPLRVRLRPEGIEAPFRRLAAVVALRGGTLDDVDEVDLRFPERVIVRPRHAGGAGRGLARPGGGQHQGGPGA